MAAQNLAPDGIITSNGFSNPLVSKLVSDDDVYLEPLYPYSDPTVRVSFPSPPSDLVAGTGLQTFNIRIKRSQGSAESGNPVVRMYLYEINSYRGAYKILDPLATGFDEHLRSFAWDASLLTDISGAGVGVYVTVVHSTDPIIASIQIDQIEWVAEYVVDYSADIAFTVPKPTVTAEASYTEPQEQFNADIAFTVPRPSISAEASYTAPQYAADIAFTVPRPSLFAAAEFMPVSGTTGWITPTNARNLPGSSGITVSNASNMATEDTAFASANLQTTGGSTVQRTKMLVWDWVDPANYPEGAVIVGVEFALYIQFDTENHHEAQDVLIYQLYLANLDPLEDTKDLEHHVALDEEYSPLWSNVQVWGGKTELFGLDPGELVSDFFGWVEPGWQDSNAALRIINDGYPGRLPPDPDPSATIKIAYAKVKLWWSIPNYVDFDATDVNFSVGIDDSAAPLQKISDLSASLSASMSASVPRVVANPYTVYADANFSVIIDPPTISEGALYTDMACWMDLSVGLAANAIRIRDMFADVVFDVDSTVYVGYSNPLFSNFDISVLMDPQLHRDVELQTDAVNPWFDVTMDVDGLVGTMALVTNMPISMIMNVDGMIVQWALYADSQFSVTASPTIASMTNLSSAFNIGVSADAPLEAIINMYSDMVIDGLLFNSAFVTLPVPAPEARTMYLQPKGRVMRLKAKGRKIILTRK